MRKPTLQTTFTRFAGTALVLLAAASVNVPAQTAPQITMSCESDPISVGLTFSAGSTTGDVLLRVVAATYPDWDASCTADPPVQMVERLVQGVSPGTVTTVDFDQLGIAYPAGCTVRITSALAIRINGGSLGALSTASCASAEAFDLASLEPGFSMVNCGSLYSATIRNDLVLTNEMDLFALEDSCLPGREYVAQVVNNPASTNAYDVSLHAKYICSKSLMSPDACTSDDTIPPGAGPVGPGQNEGSIHATLDPSQGTGMEFWRFPGQWALPKCCDNPLGISTFAAVQCASYAVTRVRSGGVDLACRPAFFSATDQHWDPVTGTFGCAFDPNNELTGPSSIFLDGDLDSFIDNCDNCPSTYNAGQEDCDADGIGDACDLPECGNDCAEPPETCDGSDLSLESCQSLGMGFTGGVLQCLPTCDGYDTSGCTAGPVCGNGIAEPPEQCDGFDFGGNSCRNLGYTFGLLQCGLDCSLVDPATTCICTDPDGDGLCMFHDPDSDNDGVLDPADSAPVDPTVCQDLDADTCDDCSVGVDGFGPLPDYNPANDGPDSDADGLCNAGDPDDDNDGVLDGADNCPVTYNPAQTDTDGDGVGDACEPPPGGGGGIGTCDPDDECTPLIRPKK